MRYCESIASTLRAQPTKMNRRTIDDGKILTQASSLPSVALQVRTSFVRINNTSSDPSYDEDIFGSIRDYRGFGMLFVEGASRWKTKNCIEKFLG